MMKRYVIERDLPGVGGMNRDQLKGAAATSNSALAKLAGKAQWERVRDIRVQRMLRG